MESSVINLKTAKPQWLKVRAPGGERYSSIKGKVREHKLATVCEEARCPNIGECWGGGTATLMLMGDTCTRGCRFCAVKTARRPPPLDPLEPAKVLDSVRLMGLSYVVLTSVDRDDLPDQGSRHLAESISLLRKELPELLVEMLIPDFRGDKECLGRVVGSGLHVLSHNIETVRRLTKGVRDPRATYQQSLDVLKWSKEQRAELVTKSSIMLGLGETFEEVLEAMEDLRANDVSILTLGQYLQPTPKHLPVQEFVTPELFSRYEEEAMKRGFEYVASGPLVRSSYRAGELFLERKIRNNPGMELVHGV